MSVSLSPRRLEAAMSAAMQLIAQLPDDDETLRRDTVEGETDALAMMDQIAERVMADEALVERARERAKRLEARADRHREIITQMMAALELTKLDRALFTASIAYRSKAMVTDADQLPDDYIRHAVDMVKLGKALHAGTAVEGAMLSNPAPVLTIRTR